MPASGNRVLHILPLLMRSLRFLQRQAQLKDALLEFGGDSLSVPSQEGFGHPGKFTPNPFGMGLQQVGETRSDLAVGLSHGMFEAREGFDEVFDRIWSSVALHEVCHNV